MKLKNLLHIACIGLSTSIIMDTILWLNEGFYIPSWTMAGMSLGMTIILQVVAQKFLA